MSVKRNVTVPVGSLRISCDQNSDTCKDVAPTTARAPDAPLPVRERGVGKQRYGRGSWKAMFPNRRS